MVEWQPLKRWLFTTNHKDVGVLYLVTSLYFFVAAGILALTFRTQLAVPSNTFLQPDEYNQAVTTHGLLMLLWVLTPLGAAFANYFVPIQIGARDMAFPRLNALSYWVYLASGLLALSSFFAGGGTADWGWTTYAPLNTVEFSPAVGGSMMGLALMLLMASSIVSTVNFLVTIFRLRAPGMSLMKLPLFTWGWIFTSLLMLWAFPAFVSALSLLVADRAFGTVFFTSTQGGPLLWDHMFWFFGHPEVYVLPRHLLGGRPLPLYDRRRRPDRPLRRPLLLVPEDHRADVQRAAREDPLRRLHRRIQPALLPHAAPLRHAAADLHLRPRHRMGADQPPHHDRGLHLRRVPTDHVCEPALELPPRSGGGPGSSPRPSPVGDARPSAVGSPSPSRPSGRSGRSSGSRTSRWGCGSSSSGRSRSSARSLAPTRSSG